MTPHILRRSQLTQGFSNTQIFVFQDMDYSLCPFEIYLDDSNNEIVNGDELTGQ